MIVDWAKPSIKLDQLHKRLDDCLNMKNHSEAFSILLEMQGEELKLQNFVLYGDETMKEPQMHDTFSHAMRICKKMGDDAGMYLTHKR